MYSTLQATPLQHKVHAWVLKYTAGNHKICLQEGDCAFVWLGARLHIKRVLQAPAFPAFLAATRKHRKSWEAWGRGYPPPPTHSQVNPVPTKDAYTCMHDGLSISQWEYTTVYGGFDTRCFTLVYGLCFFWLFLKVGTEVRGRAHTHVATCMQHAPHNVYTSL